MGPVVLCSPFVLAIYQTRSLAHRYFSVLYLNWFIENVIFTIVSYIRRGIGRNKRWANIWNHKFSKWLVKLIFESFESQRNPSKAFLVIMKTIFIFYRIKSIIIIVLLVSHVSQLKALSLVTLVEMDLGLYIKIRTFLCLFSCSSLLTTFGVKLCFVTWSQPHFDSFDNPMQLENPAFVHLFLPL